MTEYILTPTTWMFAGGDPIEAENPLEWLMYHGEADCVLTLVPGAYNPFDSVDYEHRYSAWMPRLIRSQDPSNPAIIDGSKGTDCIGFTNPECHPHPERGIVFENLNVWGGYRSALMSTMNAQEHFGTLQPYEGVTFIDCVISGKQASSKWGARLHRTGQWVFSSCVIEDVYWEHGLYYSQALGHMLLDNCVIHRCGRTAVQATARDDENGGDWSTGHLRIRGCQFAETGQMDGGSAITISGQQGHVFIEKTTVDETGLIGGSLCIWPEYSGYEGKMGRPNGAVAIVNSSFKGVAKVSACDLLYLEGGLFKGNPNALEINPTKYGMAGDIFPVGHIINKGITTSGGVWYGETKVS